jgi:hypothetical protein
MAVPMGQICERGVCENTATVRVGDEYLCEDCRIRDLSYKIRKIRIDPHYCSREEYGNLIRYLEDNCWDYTFINEQKKVIG